MPLAPRSSWLKKMWQELEGFLSSSKSWGQHLSKLSLTAGRIIWSSYPSVCSLILQVRKLNPRGIVTCPKPCIQQYIKQFHELIHFPLYSLVSSNVSPRHFVFNSLLLCSQIVAAPNISNGEILVHNLLFSLCFLLHTSSSISSENPSPNLLYQHKLASICFIFIIVGFYAFISKHLRHSLMKVSCLFKGDYLN